MKSEKIKVLFIAALVFFSACVGNKNSNNIKAQNSKTISAEKLQGFLDNFPVLDLPLSSSKLRHSVKVEDQYIDIITDVTDGFIDLMGDGKLRFKNTYFYVGKFPVPTKAFTVIILAEIPTMTLLAPMDIVDLDYKLYTLSNRGKIISSIPFTTHDYSTNENYGPISTIDKNWKIEIKSSDEQKNYMIDENGNIKLKETKKIDANNSFIDSRDGKIYKTVKIGDQIWLAENFAFKPENVKYGGVDGNFWAVDDDEANIEKYGYLYEYETVADIIPKGWHLPTKAEFETLLNRFGGNNPFVALTGDEKELNVVYSGWFYEESSGFVHKDNEVGFWSATYKDDEAWLCIINKEFKRIDIRKRFSRGVGAAIRLIKDTKEEDSPIDIESTGF